MNTDIDRVQQLLEEALRQPQAERSAYLDRVCGPDAELRAEVESLLVHAAAADDEFLQPPQVDAYRNAPAAANLVGTRLGPYRVCAVIAAGGMATVYEAKQTHPRRTVAIKVMHPWAWSRSAERRFEFEERVLATLTHPNIARIYEAGRHEDTPYFVMEYVPDASRITDYAAEHDLDIPARLRLMASVCDAVQHGHQKSIIHRDLKPSNVLVDGEGHVKIIDFGVARATDSDVTLTTIQTDARPLIGTLQYMSPEQCESDSTGLDVRTDVYSLGVILYELVCGQLPYDVSTSTITQAARTICEQVPPAPRTIRRALRGDLELILLKALDKNPDRRYQTAGDLARDTRHYLEREPIEAKPPTLRTRVGKSIARHPILFTTFVCLFIALSTLVTTQLSVAYLHSRPDRMERDANGYWARVVSRDGNILKEWKGKGAGAISFAKLVERPKETGGGKIAVLGFGWGWHDPGAEPLGAFDAKSQFEDRIWTAELHDEDLPAPLRDERGFTGADFAARIGDLADVFPHVPGPEIVAVHNHTNSTHSALRVYDLRGAIRYQVWLDVHIHGLHWMADPGLLVLAGKNGTAFWPERGHPEVTHDAHPAVVFAVRPTLEYRTTDYLSETPGSGPRHPAWYKCLFPPSLAHHVRLQLFAPIGRFESARHVDVYVSFQRPEPGAGFTLLLDRRGNEVPQPRVIDNAMTRFVDRFPNPDDLYLADLPPLTR